MNFRKLFVITREFQKRDMPDDLMQLTLEFLGDIDESVEELRNKHAFVRIETSITGKTFGHYCQHCRSFFSYKTNKGLARHCNSNYHKLDASFDRPKKSLDEMKQMYHPAVINVIEIEYKQP